MADQGSSGQAFSLADVDYDAVYRGDAALENGAMAFDAVPWDIGEAQPLLVDLEREGGFRGHVLDIGCGAGDNADFLAGRGHRVTGIDGSQVVIDQARTRAAERGVEVEFLVADTTRLAGIGQRFDSVLDSALYHCLPEDSRAAYSAALHRVSRPGARLHMFCFADNVPGSNPILPFRVSKENLRANLGDHWNITSIEATSYFTVLTREVMQRMLKQFAEAALAPGFDLASLGTDEHGRLTFPVWHVRAERRESAS